ncbi:MAG: baseplate wedge protein 53 [Minisyncoccia bacterium]
MKYFEKFPIITYQGRKVRDITRRAAFKRAIATNPYLYYSYTVKEGERAEDVARFYYGSVDYIWLVYMANNIIDPYDEWPMDPSTFNAYLVEKYSETSGEVGEDVIDLLRDPDNDENILYYVRQV